MTSPSEETPPLPAEPTVTPIFVSHPPEPTTSAAVEVDQDGRPLRWIEAESAEAASHWDCRYWRHL